MKLLKLSKRQTPKILEINNCEDILLIDKYTVSYA